MSSGEYDENDGRINEWILEPVASAISFIASEHVLAGIIEKSLITMAGFPAYVELAATHPRLRTRRPGFQSAVRTLQKQASENAELLKNGVGDHFERVYAHHIISVWGATETCIETTLQNCYLHVPSSHLIAKSCGYTKAKPAANMYEARKLIRGWTSKISHHDLKGAEVILSAFDFDCIFDDGDVRTAQDISAIRNCILHNKGKITAYYLEMSPELRARFKVGDNIVLTKEDCSAAFSCCGNLLRTLLNAILASPHMKIRDDT